ncbi:pyruvate:ferredoxin (flavodoxin) oxidoreductase [Histomonas meleagridis]|uniref:pyruvate:ferredoxin (flavodoxin) oxidoreductase n=1 Tax=Histomonas meleagridis TaxID=135588 RepID=UPI00355AA76A|nr:pyruvate:ferredoxin (flavodoxin) oxidoreductase [Histomonas meleagridis]KAH0805637.1 pyruvate:ferredoxin (flavodoxin) oxidoreductase [Histomonas meleagridis]
MTSLMLRNFGKRVPGDGNTAAASVAYALSEASFIYPITPATTMGELVDAWIAQGKKNIWGNPVHLRMLESEGGAAGAVHGATSVGTLTSSFTASQGLLLMIPDLYKIAGEYCPAVLHVTARSLSLGGLSIYNDHGDVYCARSTNMPMLCSNGVQEAHDLAAIAHLTTIKTGLPFLHFFDGFRTSHEINTYEEIDYDVLRKLVDEDAIARMRKRSLNPEHPSVRGTIVGPEYVWQSAEKPARVYGRLDKEVEDMMDRFAKLTGRHYKPVQYVGTPNDEYAIVMLGSGNDTVEEYIRTHPGCKIGLVKIHLYRPFKAERILAALPPSVKRICVMDKVRDITGVREPLYLDVAAALQNKRNVEIIGGRYGIGSKDFAPQHVEAIAKNLVLPKPKDQFTVGLNDPQTAIPVGEPKDYLPSSTRQCLFWGLGADGTVGANKQAIKLIVSNTKLYGQAYFAYDAHKSGGLTLSHLRFGEKPIDAPYYVQQADYVACHCPSYLKKFDTISQLKQNGTFVMNIAEGTDFDKALPASMRKKLAERNAKIYYIDATALSYKLGIPGRINMIMQTVFFALANVLPQEKCIPLLKESIAKQYARKGKDVIQKNQAAVDSALAGIHELKYDREAWLKLTPETKHDETGFDKIVQCSIENRGDDISVDEISDYTEIPAGTAKKEKRGIAVQLPTWNSKVCIQCNQCSIVCPHAVIRPYLLNDSEAKGLVTVAAKGKELKGLKYRIQISPLDCTGCGVCVNVCPVNALSMVPFEKIADQEKKNFEQCSAAPNRGNLVSPKTVRGSQFQLPLVEYNGACPGCGEPAIIKLLTQLYGDQLYMACATGCSLIWGATYPFNPFCTNDKGHGPAWANSLFEDNAEFGYGIFEGVQARRTIAKNLIKNIVKAGKVSGELKNLFEQLLENYESKKSIEIAAKIQPLLKALPDNDADIKRLKAQADVLARKSVWIMGGDGWAYDIGYGGLDHVLASGENVKVVVLDTEVYSNTGGQCSKATQRGAVANFSVAGYTKQKKDLGAIAMTYGNIYVANTCLLADPQQALKALVEAEEYDGPALIINYSPCINHGVKKGLGSTPKHCKDLVKSGYIVLYRYDPRRAAEGKVAFQLDSKEPNYDIAPLVKSENRFASLVDLYPNEAKVKHPQLIADLKHRYNYYASLAKKN